MALYFRKFYVNYHFDLDRWCEQKFRLIERFFARIQIPPANMLLGHKNWRHIPAARENADPSQRNHQTFLHVPDYSRSRARRSMCRTSNQQVVREKFERTVHFKAMTIEEYFRVDFPLTIKKTLFQGVESVDMCAGNQSVLPLARSDCTIQSRILRYKKSRIRNFLAVYCGCRTAKQIRRYVRKTISSTPARETHDPVIIFCLLPRPSSKHRA